MYSTRAYKSTLFYTIAYVQEEEIRALFLRKREHNVYDIKSKTKISNKPQKIKTLRTSVVESQK